MFDNKGELLRENGNVQVPEHIWVQIRESMENMLEANSKLEKDNNRLKIVLDFIRSFSDCDLATTSANAGLKDN